MSGTHADFGASGGRVRSVNMGSYIRHDLTRANGGTVHEFTNAKGQVFAVTWSGPGKPDLRVLLGRYFTTLQDGEATPGVRGRHLMRRPIAVDRSDVQLQMAGHMGWFRGVAFIRALAPAGFAVADLPQPL